MTKTRLATAVAALVALPASASATLTFNFDHLWTFAHTVDNGTGTYGSEIVSFDPTNARLWVIGTDANADDPLGLGGIDVLDLYTGSLVKAIDLSAVGGVNSVAIANGKAGVALAAPTKTDPGLVRFFDATTFDSLADVTVGANPDNIVATPDGSRFLTANEGEPSSYLIGPAGDPEGSVSIIDASTFAVQTAGFTAYNASAAALRAAGVRIYGPNASVAQDLEPEYVAVSADGATAFVTLQENNAIAVVDIATATVVDIKPLGLKDHSLPGNGFDASDRDGPGNNPLPFNIQNWNVFGMYQPDAIAAFVTGGTQYYAIANEGDARADWEGFNEELRLGNANIDPALDAALKAAHGDDYRTNNDKLSRLNITNATGDTDGDGDLDEIHVYGARSFSILDAEGKMIFDSGDALEQIIKAQYPALWDDGRSDNKGPEPESVVVGEIAGRSLLFLGLERSNAVMVWDVSDVAAPTFIHMLFTAGDVSPEGLAFVSHNGAYYLAVANEVSATTTLYGIQAVPVPAAVWLFASALAGLGFMRRRS